MLSFLLVVGVLLLRRVWQGWRTTLELLEFFLLLLAVVMVKTLADRRLLATVPISLVGALFGTTLYWLGGSKGSGILKRGDKKAGKS